MKKENNFIKKVPGAIKAALDRIPEGMGDSYSAVSKSMNEPKSGSREEGDRAFENFAKNISKNSDGSR